MIEQIKWKDVYESWKLEGYSFSASPFSPVCAETVFVEYDQGGYIDGYDWLEDSEAQERKLLIEKNPVEFLYFTQPTNKGTIQTAGMLVEAQSEEEIAATWVAATAKELLEYRGGNGVGRYADLLHRAACDFLKERYFLWHHAMKKLVPRIMVPSSVLNSMVCRDVKPVIGLIVMNSELLRSKWKILRYSSLKSSELTETHYRIAKE